MRALTIDEIGEIDGGYDANEASALMNIWAAVGGTAGGLAAAAALSGPAGIPFSVGAAVASAAAFAISGFNAGAIAYFSYF